MVNSPLMKYEFDENANIFHAAESNDVGEMQRALEIGQSLDSVDVFSTFTPIMVAILNGSHDFLDEALGMKFNPWRRDLNERLAIDHAYALGLREVHRALLKKMYPPGWRRTPSRAAPQP